MHRDGWRGRGEPRRGAAGAATALMLMRHPVEIVLSRALRRIARRRPEVFERLGSWRTAAVVIEPSDFPVSFRLSPDGARGTVRVIRQDDPAPAAAQPRRLAPRAAGHVGRRFRYLAQRPGLEMSVAFARLVRRTTWTARTLPNRPAPTRGCSAAGPDLEGAQ